MKTQKCLLRFVLSLILGMSFSTLPTLIFAESEGGKQDHFISSKTPIILLSANDAEIYAEFYNTHNKNPQDSITVIKLTPDKPPVIRTVYGTVPSSIVGAPRMAIIGNGRYGVVSDNPTTLAQLFGKEAMPKDPVSLVNLIDLQSSNLEILDSVELRGGQGEDGSLSMVVAHPDGERFIVNTDIALHMFRIINDLIVKVASIRTTSSISSFDISPDGDLLLGANSSRDGIDSIDLFKITDTAIQFQSKVVVPEKGLRPIKPFAIRISPSGEIAIVLNGGGNPYTGSLSDALIVDIKARPPRIRSSIPDIGDGLENVAFHPDGHLAVIACLDDHLAVIDLKPKKPRLLYHLDSAGLPEGLEFLPDGSQLFVGLTGESHIAVYDVEGYKLTKKPMTLQTGHHPVAMAIWGD